MSYNIHFTSGEVLNVSEDTGKQLVAAINRKHTQFITFTNEEGKLLLFINTQTISFIEQ